MKKFFAVAALAALTMMEAYAGGPYKFEKDADGDYFLSGEFQIDCSEDVAWKRLNTYVESVYAENMDQITADGSSKTMVFKGCKETSKFIYNPFAGTFKDDIHYELTLSVKGDTVSYIFTNLVLESSAAGFANYDNKNPMRVFMRNYKAAVDKAQDQSLSKKEKKSANKEVEDFESSLDKAQETLLNRISAIKTNIE